MTETTSPAMPRYTSFKTVEALVILEIVGSTLHFVSPYRPIEVAPAWIDKHQPRTGGYFVRYADGYESYSPPSAFTAGYVRDSGERPFDWVEINASQAADTARMKDMSTALHNLLVETAGDPRLMAMARSNLEIAVMLASKAIARRKS